MAIVSPPARCLDDKDYERLFEMGARGGGKFAKSGEMFESVISDIYRLVLKGGELVVDGGANAGQHAIPLAEAVGDTGLVIAVEAIPRIAAQLKAEAGRRKLHQIRVVEKALYNRKTTTTFHLVENNPAFSGIERREYYFDAKVSEISVPTTTIDALLKPLDAWYRPHRRRWRFCKLDLEGGELRALQGGREALMRHRPLIVFENGQIDSARYYHYTAEEWFDFFDGVDYSVFTLWGRSFTRAEWGRTDVPWYFIAGPSRSNETDFLLESMPSLLSAYLN